MVGNGRADVFFGLITPHGLLELTCVFVAAGVGPADRLGLDRARPDLTRGQSLAEAGRSGDRWSPSAWSALLAVAALLEAFVTPSPVPVALRVGLGAMVWLRFPGLRGRCSVAGRRRRARTAERATLAGRPGPPPTGPRLAPDPPPALVAPAQSWPAALRSR